MWHWMVHSHVWPLSSHGSWRVNWNWTNKSLNSPLSEKNNSRKKYLSMFPFELFGVKTNPAKSAQTLGVIYDKTFTWSHISAVCNSGLYHMWDLRRIWCSLDLDSAKLVETALVSSHLDYCNSLLYGIANIDLTRLQHVQNGQSLLHLLAVLHCFIPFIGCP